MQSCDELMIVKMAAPSESVTDLIAEDKLVELCSEYPCLYNVRCAEFRDRNQRQMALDEIAEKVQSTADWVKNRLRQLRSVFTRNNKPASSGSARKNVSKRTAWVMEKFKFMLPYVASRTTETNLQPCSPSRSRDREGNNDSITDDNGFFSTMPKSTKLLTRKRPKTGKDEELILLQSLACSINKRKAPDEWASFGQFVAESLRKLDTNTQYTAQHLINKIIFETNTGMLNSSLQQTQQTQYMPTLSQPPPMFFSNHLQIPSSQHSQMIPQSIPSNMFTTPFNQPPIQQQPNMPQFPNHDSHQMLFQCGQPMATLNNQDEQLPQPSTS